MKLRLIDIDALRVATMQNGQIHCGVADRDGWQWKEHKDVTADVLRAVVALGEQMGESQIGVRANGTVTHVITIQRVAQ